MPSIRLVRCFGWALGCLVGSIVSSGVLFGMTHLEGPHAGGRTADFDARIERLADRAALMGEAIVSDVQPGWSPTRGARTYVTLNWIRLDRGPAMLAGTSVVVRELGGQVGDQVLVVPGAPAYRTGEHVYVFLAPSSDGALRTVGMADGRLVPSNHDKRRFVGAQGEAEISRGDLFALALRPRETGGSKAVGASSPAWLSRPAELGQVTWAPKPRFTLLESDYPTRWTPFKPLRVHVDLAGNPLGDDDLAREALLDAARAWAEAPGTDLTIDLLDEPFDHTSAVGTSPLATPEGMDVVLFGDPYDDLDDPVDCFGTVATGGYWRSENPTGDLDGRPVYDVTRLFVIFNNGFECFLEDPLNVAEVANHELGHGLGFGHSTRHDSVMRAAPYGGRGARLGNDDMDGAACLYPTELKLRNAAGGEVWVAGEQVSLRWDRGEGDDGDTTVDVFISVDGGGGWTRIAESQPSSGSLIWTVPDLVEADLRVRVAYSFRDVFNWLDAPDGCVGSESRSDIRIRRPHRRDRLWRPQRGGAGWILGSGSP